MPYLVTAPSKTYQGKVYGIRFNDGRAIIADEMLNPDIKLKPAEIVKRMKQEFGFTAVALDAKVVQAMKGEGSDEKPKGKRLTTSPKATRSNRASGASGARKRAEGKYNVANPEKGGD